MLRNLVESVQSNETQAVLPARVSGQANLDRRFTAVERDYLRGLSSAKIEHVIKQFLARIDRGSSPIGCWLWTGTIMGAGYGKISVQNRVQPGAHRFSYELYRGPIPEGASVLHRCDVRRCVNPDHLFLGTQKENIGDMWEKGRQQKYQRGSARVEAKLDESKVAEILVLLATTRLSHRQIAERYGVTTGVIGGIAIGITWKHVPRPEGYAPRGQGRRV